MEMESPDGFKQERETSLRKILKIPPAWCGKRTGGREQEQKWGLFQKLGQELMVDCPGCQ